MTCADDAKIKDIQLQFARLDIIILLARLILSVLPDPVRLVDCVVVVVVFKCWIAVFKDSLAFGGIAEGTHNHHP